MQYRKFGKTGEEVSVLGFGAMRLPVVGKDESKIDKQEAKTIIRAAIDSGLNYIDTAYPYHGGNSEAFVAEVLEDGYRDKVKIATKLPSWSIKTRKDMDDYLNKQLGNLKTDCVNFLLLHTLCDDYWQMYKDNDVKGFVEQAKRDNKIKHIGFSFHDDLPVFKKIVDEFDWDFCMFQYNFMDENHQAGKQGLKYAHDKGLGIAIMEPLRGGALVKNIPDDVQKKWDSLGTDRSVANWALRYLWDQPEVDIVLSGMSSIQQVRDNLKEADLAKTGCLSENQKEVIGQIRDIYKSRMVIDCTACKYCMPCPYGVDIPGNFAFLNNGSMYQDMNEAKRVYTRFFDDEFKSKHCVACGACEPTCPQHIPIIEKLKLVNKTLG